MFTPAASYRFGPYVLDATSYRLVHDGEPIPLSPKALDLLFLFAGRPGALMTKEGILAELWPDVAVTDNALTQVVSEVRQAIGDNPASPRYVETVPRRGYRFVASVESMADGRTRVPSSAAAPAADVPAATRAIAVLDFTNVSQDADLAWLSAGIAETIGNALRAVRDVRVVDRASLAAARSSGSLPADVVITGSVQRSGDQLRLTAQAIDARTQQAMAQAKADGAVADVFRLQDEIVSGLVAGLQMTVTPAAAARIHARETASLEAYRALTEGRLKLETLDPRVVPDAMADFERAIRHDPEYAFAYVGLAHACFWRFQASRALQRPDRDALAQAIAHARHAVDLDPELAEGHAALAFFLVSADRPREAVLAGRVATALEPANWRHRFRLGVAAWGDERVECLESVMRVYPQLGYAAFGLAMVHIARGQIDRARATLDAGVAAQARRPAETRFPGAGLHWLLGLIALGAGDVAAADAAFDREVAQQGNAMFADEFAMDAWNGKGFARFGEEDYGAAVTMFEHALARVPGHAKSLLCLAEARHRLGQRVESEQAGARAREAIEALRASGRESEAAMASACGLALHGRTVDAILTLDELLTQAPPGHAGWTIPVEPFARLLHAEPAFQSVLDRLAARAR